jgi:hypothetical protein
MALMPSTILWVNARSLLALGATMAIFNFPAAPMAAGAIKKTARMTLTTKNLFE